MLHAMTDAESLQGGISAIRTDLQSRRASLKAQFASDGNPSRLLRQHRMLVDRMLKTMWSDAGIPGSLALVAVGGYGRGTLFPHSDVDLLVLLPEAPPKSVESKLEALIGRLWDVGLEVGHSVRTLAQCEEEAAKDLTVQTTFLEARLIVGQRALFRRFAGRTMSHFDPHTFFNAKRLEQEQRHAKYQDTPYSLEPNIKEAPGGMRDLQTILWIARACGLGTTWSELAKGGFVTRTEARQLAGCERLLYELRIRLHYAAGRREDRLLFDVQDRIAGELGHMPTAHRRASELLMQRYFRTAKAVTQLNTILLQNIGAAIFRERSGEAEVINERFQAVRELLDARDANLFEKHPETILESFQIMQQRPELKGMTAQTLRALWRARSRIDGAFRRDPRNRAAFLSLLQQPRGIVHELRRMNQYGILGRYLPPFRRIVGQMQHDLFHVYTVDQHSLAVVRNLRRFTMVEFSHEYPLCSRLIAGFERHWLLYVAAIFHDIAKGRGGDHSELGAVDAARFCRAHGLSPEDIALVVFLVRHHLTMSKVAQKQDLYDPQVIQCFASIVGTERRLIALYLLTVADIRGTSPKVWNAWRGKLLEDLFHLGRRLLRGQETDYDQDIYAKQSEAKRLLRLYALSDTVQEELWKQLDVAYFLRHDATDIAWQARLLHYRVNTEQPVVKARLSPAGEGLQVMIYTHDQRYLFARICGFFSKIGFNIVDAKIHTARHGFALDTFQVMGSGNMPHYRDMINLIEHDLGEQIEKQTELPAPPQARLSRQLRHFPITPEVHIVPDEQGRYYALSIIAGDRPGLLYAIARLFGQYEISLHTAKIVTLGERVEDVFRISGDALGNPRVVLHLEQDLLELLQA
ncbi:MAG: [protein-PII] uridylyltransferase [Betaproteobacteria bacterium RIFCSPLOWO2_12_FULL_63_13]|nr:MAG: [protein-PII] uridylyltransferase [Betaproteobacteria bacterium RIFCSPLOWO2_12_FULL_63_13]